MRAPYQIRTSSSSPGDTPCRRFARRPRGGFATFRPEGSPSDGVRTPTRLPPTARPRPTTASASSSPPSRMRVKARERAALLRRDSAECWGHRAVEFLAGRKALRQHFEPQSACHPGKRRFSGPPARHSCKNCRCRANFALGIRGSFVRVMLPSAWNHERHDACSSKHACPTTVRSPLPPCAGSKALLSRRAPIQRLVRQGTGANAHEP